MCIKGISVRVKIFEQETFFQERILICYLIKIDNFDAIFLFRNPVSRYVCFIKLISIYAQIFLYHDLYSSLMLKSCFI